jgi:competence protein ComFB
MNFKNYMEDVVVDVYQEFKKTYFEYCGCDRCSADIMVLALTKLKGKYAVSLTGEIFASVSRDDRQIRTDALIAIKEAAEQVKVNPNHPIEP